MNYNLTVPFHENARRQPEAGAVVVEGARYSYGEMASLASRVAAWLRQAEGRGSGRVGILAARSLEAYGGVLGTLWAGQAYVPVNPHTPEDRLLRIFQLAELDALVVDQAGMDLLSERALARAPRRILAGRDVRLSQAAPHAAGLQVRSFADLPEAGIGQPVAVADDDLAYVLFTSGTTGTPKGVMIEAGSVAQFRSVVQQRCAFTPSDRVSQVAELTFDNSVLDLFVTWAAGAELHVVPEAQLMAPAKFIREHALTVWFSVPSTACMMDRMRMLKPGAFPSLRLSIFAGEALPIAAARAWQKAATNSVVENFYGPTEVTVDCIAQRLEEPPKITRNRGSLAIGMPFPGIEAGIVDAELRFLPPEQEGELVVSGRQVARGYFKDAELTAARFPSIDGRRWYRTGDLAYQDATGAFHHLGRIDNQVKVLGNRVELEEVEAHLREIIGSDVVAAVAWPVEDERATGIVAFHCDPAVERNRVREGMQQRVPAYMVPERVCRLDAFPLGSTGKIDRKALLRMLDEGELGVGGGT
ncbi:MAG TPA: amino acid adenylation domain-containing protein [Acidobacteriaceae bacterium]